MLVGQAILSAEHWQRLEQGELLATSSRLDWAVLIRRTHGIDALRGPWCEAKMRPLATITGPTAVGAISNTSASAQSRCHKLARETRSGQASFGEGAA